MTRRIAVTLRSMPMARGIALLCLVPSVIQAQPDRISSRIDSARAVPLSGHLNPNTRVEDDRGPVDPFLEISYATLYLKPSAAQQAALEKLLVDQQDPASPDYHRWLTPEEFGGRFGLSPGDAAKIAAWLESQGIQVNDVARGRHWITFSGPAAKVAAAFQTEIHHYRTNGEMHFANATAPSIPEALADVVAGVGGLDDYYPEPAGGKRQGVPTPEYTNSSGAHALAPDDFATIYDLKPLYAEGIDGSGLSIAVIGNTDIDLTDIRNFRSRFNLPPKDPTLLLAGPDPGVVSEDEAYLDLEWAGAVARNAALIFVYAKSVNTAAQYAVDQRLAPIITESFGTCEPAATSLTRAIAQQANAEGITWIASSGDGGAAGCDHQGKLPFASKGMAVASPASIPEVTAVGGSEFDDAGGVYWNGNNSNGASAIAYIPENAWNDSLAGDYLAASTGGPSTFYSKPWWQIGWTPNDGARDVPDIALNASWSHDPYLIYANGGLYGQGGTSASAPAFAGYVALLNHYLLSKGAISKPGLGNINPGLYRLAQSAPAAFHDIVNGDNVVPCLQGTPNCSTGSFGYVAGPGYDLATGLGSIDGYKLATNWITAANTSTSVSAAPATVAFAAGAVKLTATVTASGGAPSGDITFLLNDEALGAATLAQSGASWTATLTVNAIQLPVGTNTITAVFGGSAGLGASAGAATVTVTPPAAASAVVASVTPNPVYQIPASSSGDTWFFMVLLANESEVPTTLTRFTIDGADYSANIVSWFGGAAIAANGFISATVGSKNLNPPVNRVFAFSGADANGTKWSQQITVPFVARMLVEPSMLLTTPASVPPDPANPSCRWPQPMVIEEQGGYEEQLTTLTSGDTDFSGQLQQIFGTTILAPFGRLQGTLCWTSNTAAGTKDLSIEALLAESSTGTETVNTKASTTLVAAPGSAAVTASASPAAVNLSPGSSQTASASVNLSFSAGAPAWSARVSPSNHSTDWLTVSPPSGAGAAQFKLTASAAGLANGVYSAMLLIQSATATPQILSVPVMLVVGGSSNISIGGVTNAASYKTVFAPGALMSVFGANLSPKPQHAGAVPLPFSMQGVTAAINGYPAPLLDVTPTQLNVQIPYEAGAGTAILGVNNNGQVASFAFEVQPSAPGIFMTLDGAGNLVPYASGQRGQALLAFITGEGDVSPVLFTGRTPTTTDVTKLPAPRLPVTLTVGGAPAAIDFIGIPPGLVGVTQINFTIPAKAQLGPQPVVVTVGGVASPPVTLSVTQ